jgi:hypothetical protein
MTVSDKPDRSGTAVVSLVHAAERVTDRISRLQWEAKVLAAENTAGFAADMHAMAARALEIAGGGDAYPPGIRDLAARLAASLAMNAKSVQAILRHVGPRT